MQFTHVLVISAQIAAESAETWETPILYTVGPTKTETERKRAMANGSSIIIA